MTVFFKIIAENEDYPDVPADSRPNYPPPPEDNTGNGNENPSHSVPADVPVNPPPN